MSGLANPAAKKSLGQHFLINQGVIDKIADRVAHLAQAASGSQSGVLEIGPGPGPLTEALLKRGLKLVAVELDHRMVEHLQQKFAPEISTGQFSLLEADALRVDLAKIRALLGAGPWVVCGNLPYNVGTHLLFRFYEECPEAESFCFMLQKELIQRLCAVPRTKAYGSATIKLQLATKIHDHFWVKAGSFAPPPKVESGVVTFSPDLQAVANPLERGALYDQCGIFVEKAFSQRRKMLRATLPELRGSEWESMRPEELSPGEFLDLFRSTHAAAPAKISDF